MREDPDNAFLYIQTSASIEDLRAEVATLVDGEQVGRRSISADGFSIELEASKTHDKARAEEHGGFVYYPFLGVVVPDPDADQIAFVDDLCRMITALRETGAKVVAASEFDDEIAAKTGWNWSLSSPDHPSAARDVS